MKQMRASGVLVCQVVFGLTLMASQAHAQASLHENFSSGALPTTLEATGGVGATCCSGQLGGPVFENGAVRFGGRDTLGDDSGLLRTYLRTIDSDYGSVDFVAEVTVTVPNASSPARNVAFFGFGSGGVEQSVGSGIPNLDGMLLELLPAAFLPGVRGDDGVSGIYRPNAGPVQCGGSGTFRLRIAWTAATQVAVLSVQPNYAGGSFVADPNCQFTFDGSDNGFDASNSRLYFGSDWDTVFDDFVITSGQAKGFYSPVAFNQPTIAKGGSTLPLKWELFDGLAPASWGASVPPVLSNEITDPAAISSLLYTRTATSCSTVPSSEPGSPVVLLGRSSSGLRYNTGSGQFIYNWVVPKVAGCYTVTLTTAASSTISARVEVVK